AAGRGAARARDRRPARARAAGRHGARPCTGSDRAAAAARRRRRADRRRARPGDRRGRQGADRARSRRRRRALSVRRPARSRRALRGRRRALSVPVGARLRRLRGRGRPAREAPPSSPAPFLDSPSVPGRTQAALYAEIDLELSWSEEQLPQVERTKHVHSLHPYLGKFIPQLVEVFLRRHFRPGDCVFDPFAGSGTTLVEANAFGAHAVGCDISAFNCLLSRVKTAAHSLGALELALKGTLEEARRSAPADASSASAWLRSWYSERALGELLAYREALDRLDGAT